MIKDLTQKQQQEYDEIESCFSILRPQVLYFTPPTNITPFQVKTTGQFIATLIPENNISVFISKTVIPKVGAPKARERFGKNFKALGEKIDLLVFLLDKELEAIALQFFAIPFDVDCKIEVSFSKEEAIEIAEKFLKEKAEGSKNE